MNYLFALGIGLTAGLRSLTAPAIVAWSAHLGWLNLRNSPLAFMGSTASVRLPSRVHPLRRVASIESSDDFCVRECARPVLGRLSDLQPARSLSMAFLFER